MRPALTRSEQKAFKSWVKDNPYTFDKDFYTQLFNINNNIKIDKWGVEQMVYAISTGKYLDSPLDIRSIKSRNELGIIRELFEQQSTLELGLFWPFLDEYFKYMQSPNKDFDEEYRILNIFWEWTVDMRERFVEDFNKWIVLVNTFVYKKQKGYK